MKRTIIALIIGCSLYAQSPGEGAFPLLRVQFYPRAVGLGETYVAMTGDAGSLWWNPGSAGWLEHSEAFISYHEWFMDIRDVYGGLAYATRMGVFGLGLVYSGTSGIEGWDANNEETTLFGQTSGIVNFTYSRKAGRTATVGLNFKGLYDRIADETGFGFGIDLGANILVASKIRIAGVVKDIGTSMKYGSTSASLPMSLRAGIAYSPLKDINVLLDGEYLRFAKPNVHFGIEYWVKEIVALRAGLKTKPNEGLQSYYTAGLGIKYQQFFLDYAFVPYSSELGMTHRVLVGTRFGQLEPRGSAVIRVVDSRDGRPIVAELTIIGLAAAKAYTDSSQGAYLLKEQVPGVVRIKAQKPKFYPKEDTLVIEKDVTTTKVIVLNFIPPGEAIGLVTDVKTKRVLGATVKYEGIVRGEAKVDSTIGLYRLSNLEPGKYVLRVLPDRPKYYPQLCTLDIEAGKTLVRDFELIREKEVIILKGVNFETARATLLPESYAILDYAGKILIENPRIIVELAGHTDNRRIKTREFPSNVQLSQARSESVRRYLIEKFNIEPGRLIAQGYADKEPLASNKTEAGRAQNRRTEFKVLSGEE